MEWNINMMLGLKVSAGNKNATSKAKKNIKETGRSMLN